MRYQQFLHSGKPTSDQLFSMFKTLPIPIISSASYPGWTDDTAMPSFDWYVNASKTKTPSGKLVVDQESWPVSTRPERLEASRRFAVVYKTLRHLMPNTRLGFYAYSPIRDFFNAITPTTSKTFTDWQSRNDDFAEHISCVDILFPSIYFFYTRKLNGHAVVRDAPLYFQRNLQEAIRLRNTYGNQSAEIIPYVWWEKHPGGTLLDADVWQSMLQISLDLTGNCLVWGGWSDSGAQVWNPSAPWLEPLRQLQGLPI